MHWKRVILDEGHQLGASLSQTNKLLTACSLRADCRWVMTGEQKGPRGTKAGPTRDEGREGLEDEVRAHKGRGEGLGDDSNEVRAGGVSHGDEREAGVRVNGRRLVNDERKGP